MQCPRLRCLTSLRLTFSDTALNRLSQCLPCLDVLRLALLFIQAALPLFASLCTAQLYYSARALAGLVTMRPPLTSVHCLADVCDAATHLTHIASTALSARLAMAALPNIALECPRLLL